ncbi:ataxin-10 homolog [Phtheirospermum japonicum]|uniref:Ataxin-10 homolog n=1 Tax=Phtheirospermum japonicum TaxID=374723 RepID=A0A830CAR0_9LAMI|nr:ataxin-10 homolog [Phtheirospermum japonicum]
MSMDNSESHNSPLPDIIIEPLFAASETSNLKNALACLIETAKTCDGRLGLASKHILVPVLELCRYPFKLSVEDLLLSLKLLRNLCAGEIKNQNLFIEQNGVETLSILVSSLGLSLGSDKCLLPMVLQVLGNVSLAGEQHCSVVWRRFFPDKFLDIAKVRSKETCDPLCMVIYTCTEGSNERSAELFAEPGQHIVVEIIKTITIAGFRQDWVKLLVSRICIEEPYFPSIFSKLPRAVENENSDENASQIHHFGAEKSLYLSILSEILNERVGDIVISNDFSLCIFEVFKSAIGIVNLSTTGNLPLPTGSGDINVIGYSLSILRNISACDPKVSKRDEKQDTVDLLVTAGLIKFLIDLLHELEPPAMIRKAMNTKDAENKTISQHYKYCCPYKGFRRDIVAVLGNCSYRKRHVQDEIRERNGILVLLQQCVIDEDNPFMREWGVWSMRNILEGNMENRQLVADLELQNSVDSPEIAGLGLRVEVDPRTRRPKLVNAS